MLITRLLPWEEWPRLAGTELETVWPHLEPEKASVVVVEDGDRIVGCWAVWAVVHVEGLWVHPDYRQKPSVGRRLWRAMRRAVADRGSSAVVTAACSEAVRDLLATARATVVPGEFFVLSMKGRD